MHDKWWHERIFYQIYPRSFNDTNGDGIGDIQGIIAKLPYLKNLGIGAIWISPLYASPNFDNGYDISDYKAINPEYGTMEDMLELLKVAEKLDIKIVMDLVINHTSFQHDWFVKSKDPQSPYHNYYFWHKGKTTRSGKRRPPNNWQSMFMGSAWQYEASNDMFYLHLFTKEQPDLNYNNPAVLREVQEIIRFWLDLGVAGFRCDVINCISKTSLKRGRQRLYKTGREHYLNTPGCHLILKELNDSVLAPYGAYTVGETMDISIDDAKQYINNELTQVFMFDQTKVDQRFLPIFPRKYRPKNMIKAWKKWQTKIEWNTVFYENHDVPRSVSRFGSEKFRLASATALGASVLFLKGTPYIYQGQEIGMTNVDFQSIKDIEDISSRNVYDLLVKLKFPRKLAFKMVKHFTRDHARTPMQWDDSLNAGFSSGTPWLAVNPNYKTINVAANQKDGNSILSAYQKMIKVRQSHEALIKGEIIFLHSHRDVLAFLRVKENERYLVVINLGAKTVRHRLDLDGDVLYANYDVFFDHQKELRPYEVQVLKLVG